MARRGKNVLFLLFILAEVYSFSLEKIGEGSWDFPGSEIKFRTKDFTLIDYNGVLLGINVFGKKSFLLPSRHVRVKKNKVYCLEKGVLLEYREKGLSNAWELKPPPTTMEGFIFSVSSFNGRLFFLAQHAPLYKRERERAYFLYEERNGILKKKTDFKSGMCITDVIPLPLGFFFQAPQIGNGTVFQGFSDFRAYVGILGEGGKILRHISFWGDFVYPNLYKIKGEFAYVGWSEVWSEARHRSGMLKLNLELWRIAKEVYFQGKENTFELPSAVLPFPPDFPIFLITDGGVIKILDDDLGVIKKIRFAEIPNAGEGRLIKISPFIGRIKNSFLLDIRIISHPNDPYTYFPKLLQEHLLIIDGDFRVVLHWRTEKPGEFFLWNASKGILSKMKEGKIEVYRILP